MWNCLISNGGCVDLTQHFSQESEKLSQWLAKQRSQTTNFTSDKCFHNADKRFHNA
jgi:hypothetical protein